MPSSLEDMIRVSQNTSTPSRSQASISSGVGMIVRCANGVAAHSLENFHSICLQTIGHGRANARVILMIACTLDGEFLSIEQKPVVASHPSVRTPKLALSRSRTLPFVSTEATA